MNIGFKGADILLPKKEIDAEKWSVVACDQFTSEPEYWEEVEKLVGNEPSTLRMILPEVFLEEADTEARLHRIAEDMDCYLKDGLFEEYKDAMIYVERTDSAGKVRAGIVGCIDLEQYDYHKGSSSLVRATEATVTSRIPPRIKVRENAKVELPHIMILIDDKDRTVIEPFAGRSLPAVYDFDLMMGGGHLKGALLGKEEQDRVISALSKLGDKEHFQATYGLDDKAVLLFAMGDGNHSLATAKEFYEQLKAKNQGKDLSDHPARYALVELVNLHSPALEFEAIHRIVMDVDVDHLKQVLKDKLGLTEAGEASLADKEAQTLQVVEAGKKASAIITKPCSKLTVGSLQSVLDDYLKEFGGKIDYIHGEDVVLNLSKKENSIGFLLEDMGKEELFPTVICDGALPRKTFSMGHAQDKRYYMEARKITR